MAHQNFFEYQATKDLNRLLREYGQTCLNSTTPAPPVGNVNITWQTDTLGNISAYAPDTSAPLNPRGAWSSGTTYAVNDLVSFSGSSYLSATSGNIGNQPDTHPANWQLVAQGGGGSNPGVATQIAFYQTTGSTVSPTSLTSSGSNLNVPGLLATSQLNSTGTYNNNPNPLFGGVPTLIPNTLDSTIFGAGWSLGNAGGWTVQLNESMTMNLAQRGIGQNRSGTIWKHAVGDTAGIYSYVRADGGISAASDEGVTAATLQSLENPNYFHGTVSSASRIGGTPTFAFTTGNPWTTDGAYLLNITKSQLNGNMNGSSVNLAIDTGLGVASTYLNKLPVTGVTVTAAAWSSGITYTTGQLTTFSGSKYVSIVNGNINNSPSTSPTSWTLVPTGQLPISTAAGIVDNSSLPISSSVAANNPVPITLVVNLAKIGGTFKAFTVGSVVTLAGANYPEQSVITAATSPVTVGSGQQQTLTMKLRNPNSQAIIFQGGIQGQYISFDANAALSGFRSSYFAFGSLDGVSLIYGLQITGGIANNLLPQIGSEAAQTTGSRSGFTLFPGAEVVANNDFGFNCTLEQNGVHWDTGDTIENPHYPSYGGSALFLVRSQFTPSNPSFGSATASFVMEGPGTGGGNTAMLRMVNNYTTLANYQGSGGPLIAPVCFDIQGQYNSLLSFSAAPNTGSVIHIGSNPTGNDLLHVFDINYAAGGNMFFKAASSTWAIDGKFDAQNGFLSNHVPGASGTFTTADSKTVTVSGGLIIGIV